MVMQLILLSQYKELHWIHFVCVSALKVAIILNCPQINPVGLNSSFKTSTASHAGYYT